MKGIKTVGFPRMHKEKGEKRDFLPKLFEQLKEYDLEIFLEKNYGEGMGYKEEDYKKVNRKINFESHEDVYKKDMVVVLRAPEDKEIDIMKEGAILISMLHYETRETRNKLLKGKKINCFSMDSMYNDDNDRIMVNYRGTSRAGSRVAFEELKKRTGRFEKIKRDILFVTVIGMGAVASNSAKAFEEFSDREFLYDDLNKGLIVRFIPRTVTKDDEKLEKIMKTTDILVDASKRRNTSDIIIKNELIKFLPEYSIILDLTADPYNEKITPIQVKGIEGIPCGTLDKYIIEPEDEIYDSIPERIDAINRRVVVSCNAWPGVEPKECMDLYGRLIFPFLDVIINSDINCLNLESKNMYARSLFKSTLDYYLLSKK